MEQARRTPIGEMHLVAPGIIMHRVEEGVSVARSDAQLVKTVTEELAAGDPVVIVVGMRGVAFASRDARDAFQEGAGGVEIGTALLTNRGFTGKLAGLIKRYSDPSRSSTMRRMRSPGLGHYSPGRPARRQRFV